jgi:hypothetical protein
MFFINVFNVINFFIVVAVGCIAIHNFISIKRHRKEKDNLINEISALYPLVRPDFYKKPLMQQTVENNHEIHQINKRLEILEAKKKDC